MEEDHHKNLYDLSDAVLSLKTKNDLDRFFKDLCTPSEIRALKERWLVCQLLYQDKLSYREINEKTKVSLSTIVRVARFLKQESNHGYKIVLEKNTITGDENEKNNKMANSSITVIFSGCSVCLASTDSSVVKIYINQFADHPALNSTTKGIIDGLEKLGYYKGKNLDIIIESAQANASLSSQIASKFANNKPDIVVGVATISSQSLSKYARENKVKLIFTTVTDPIGASLIKDLKKPGNNTSGVSNFVELEPQFEMFKALKPNLKKLGFLYNPGELNSISLIKQLQKICPKYGMELVVMPANKTSEVYQSAIKLTGMSDAIFVSNDNTALSAIGAIVSAANKNKIPVFVSDTDIVDQGALAALGPNQYDVGLQTAELIYRVLKGEDINNIAVEFPKKTELYLNVKAAKAIDLEVPNELKLKASKIID